MTGTTTSAISGIRRFMGARLKDKAFWTYGLKLNRPRRSNTRLGKVSRKWFGNLAIAWDLVKGD